MEIQRNSYSPAFSARFTNNKAFKEVVEYAEKNKCLRTLDSALNTIKKANDGEITILHGQSPNGGIYSAFTTGRRSVSNEVSQAKTPAEASFDGILELGFLTKKFKSLLGTSKVKQDITPQRIVKEYTI